MHSRVLIIITRSALNKCEDTTRHNSNEEHAACRRRTVICPYSIRLELSWLLSVFQRVLVGLKYTLLHELLWIGPVLQTLLEAVSLHMVFKLSLLLLQGRCGIRRWEDVSLNKIIAVRAGIEALLEIVGCTLTFKLESFGLEGADIWSTEDTCSTGRSRRK